MSKHNVNEVTSDEHFQQLLKDRSVVALNFWASWNEPCKDMNEVFEELSRKYPAVQFVQLEAENYPDISEHYEIAAVPTFIILKDGKTVNRVEGANAPALTSGIEKFAKVAAAAATSASVSSALPVERKKDLQSRLKELVSSHPVMIFIKGTPQQPRCGFSRQSVELLSEVGVKYGSFNILADEEVRQGLKEYSNWPTFPQIYVNGELIGGLDILKEMIESGEFQKLVPAEEDLESRLKKLINQAPVMLFMKGSPDTPRCGFSRQITQLLKDQGIDYQTFDILEDEEVRQGLKTFSSWPTYPQLYVNGELVGGLDIVKEMVESGDLKAMLTSA
ncbi:Grx4 family monothiol glutaredoxin [Spizellomyces punctatus DAOM BR117]|uniref:Grx4 family monothiol glutaredoxin n=1 Tax=Spizellomyces punctatus (strain DAOM BR117) TaxID=645134 RepID=A0A0L0H5F0_SPIPD|nr:Grx4 family monothiol glutaredoxin [Spizellomyces punctatus DAOM BR117]KNC96121.1 Grx4 family monothiol glutaredoxin [Spizellomyces punctatus DAOM BR117]|eukprot:XP_016604161.1 Grx4 family monothiol glutaredoxin [Spizellomyces punctatus DAOM BR117]